MTDTYNLQRFIDAQNLVIDQVEDELVKGIKETCWVWFVFPSLSILGQSENSKYYGIESLDEAIDYLNNPILGPRLHRHLALILTCDEHPLDILGYVDILKFRSSMTLFNLAGGGNRFSNALTYGTCKHTERFLEKGV